MNVSRTYKCSCWVHEGDTAELVKHQQRSTSDIRKSELSSLPPPRSSFSPAQGLKSFLTSYSFPCIAPGGPSTFKPSENKSRTVFAVKQPEELAGLMEHTYSSHASPQHSTSSMCVRTPRQFPGGFSCAVRAFCTESKLSVLNSSTVFQQLKTKKGKTVATR